MDVFLPYIWLIVVVVMLIFEAMTVGLTTIWFAGGALIAAIAAFFHVGLVNQILIFVCVSLVLVILMRPIAIKYMNKSVSKTNVNSIIGKKAIVTKEINNLAQTGQVKIGDIEWKARAAEDDAVISEGTTVVIEAVNGVKLIVRE